MSWTEFLRSRYVRQLEKDLADLRASHTKELEAVEKRFNDALEARKTIHSQELDRAINEANRGWAEADRLRQYLIPGLPAANRVTETSDKESSAQTEDVETGTPWQRILTREMKKQDFEAKAIEEARKAQHFPTVKDTPASPAKEN